MFQTLYRRFAAAAYAAYICMVDGRLDDQDVAVIRYILSLPLARWSDLREEITDAINESNEEALNIAMEKIRAETSKVMQQALASVEIFPGEGDVTA